jgi:hypothetical protein
VQAPVVINGRLDKAGEVDKFRVSVQPGDQLLIEMQARELGTSKIEGIITAYGPDGKKIDSAGDKPLPEDVFAVQGTSRTSNDPFLNLKVPAAVSEITLAVEDLAERGGQNYAYRLIVRKQPEDFRLSVTTPFINIPAGGTALVTVAADRRGYDGPIQLRIPKLPAGVRVEGGYIPREYVDPNNTRTLSRRGALILSADTDVTLGPGELVVYGEGETDKGDKLVRRATAVGTSIEVAGATAQGVVDRQRALTAPWLGLDLPFAIGTKPIATLEIKQINLVRMDEGDRFDFHYQWRSPEFLNFPRELNVDVIGARDIRVTAFERESPYSGTFSVNTTKATDPARYDVIVRGRIKTESGNEDIYAPPVALVVTKRGGENATAQSR